MRSPILFNLCAAGAILFLAQPAFAQVSSAPQILKLKDLPRPATTVKEWMAQVEAATVQVTGVKLERTDTGLEITLETSEGKPLQVDATKFRTEGNSVIADIPNAVLTLAEGNEFNTANPTAEIAAVRVTQVDANTIRVNVVGNGALPKQEVTLKTGAFAYSLNPEGEEPDEEIVVTGERSPYRAPNASTATRTDTPLRDIPQSIQVVPRQVLEDQNIIRISDALLNVSSVTKQGSFAGATDAYTIRGFTSFDNLRNGFTTGDNVVNPTNIERIEVLKGPASVLYGQLEPGGVVNYITKQPLSEPYYSAEFTAGNFNTYRPSIDISGPLNSDKTLLYRLNAAYENSGNFVDFVDQKLFAIAPVLTYKIGDTTTLTLEYEYLNLNRTFYDGLLPDPISFNVPIRRFLGEPGDSYFQETHSVSFSVNHRFSENIRLRSAFFAIFNNSNDPGKDVAFRPSRFDADGRTVLRRFADGSGFSQNYSFQTDLISNFRTGSVQHQLLLGLEWSKLSSSGDFLRSSIDLTPSIDVFNPVYGALPPPEFDEASERESSERNRIGLYLQDQVTLLPNLKLLVGGRYDFIRNESRNQSLDPLGNNPIGDESVDRLYDEAFSPRVGIVYQPIPAISIYASYSRSFNPSSSRTVDRTQLPPERGTQYEVGIRAETANGKLSATLAAYEITKTNVATTDPDNTDFSIAAGEVKSRGIEFDVAGEILPGWNVIASAFVNDAFVSKDNSLPVGDRPVGAPSQGASLWTTYEIQEGDWKGFGVGGGVFFVGNQEAQLPNTFEIPSYVRADATIFYKRNNWKISLNFKNLTSTRYYETQGFYLRPGAPFTVLGTISVNF